MAEEKKFFCFDSNMGIQHVNGEKDLNDKLAEKADPVLRIEAIQGEGGNDARMIQAATFARMELDRRSFEETKKLTNRSTWISALIGVGGTVFGVLLGWLLS